MGYAWIFGNYVNTDEIIPGRYNVTTNHAELAKRVFYEVRPDFSKNVQKDDIIVAGRNFGCGSSREHAPIAIKAAGVKVVIAKSFARIFYRNAINIGLPILECEDIDGIKDGDTINVNLLTGIINTSSNTFKAKPLPGFILKIFDAGGIINFLKENDLEDLQT